MTPFERFWAAWPRSPRKASKTLCQQKWDKMKLDSQVDHIVAHVSYMATTDNWKKGNGDFIPAPLVYINQMRWDGAEIPEPETKVNVVLQKMEEHKAAPMPLDVAKKLQELKKSFRLH